MKKTLLATAIAGAIAATGMMATTAQAATVYDQDGTKVDIYGSIRMAVQTGGDQVEGEKKSTGSEFKDMGSRFGFIANHELDSDLSVFARLELRGKADANNTDGFSNIRNSFVGLRSQQFGTVQVGNFDSIFYQVVSSVFDVPQGPGLNGIDTGAVAARGDSVQYSTPNLEGFQAHIAAKHLSGNGGTPGLTDNSSTLAMHGGVSYEIDALYLGAAYNQAKDVGDRGASYDGGGGREGSEDLWGLVASYAFTPEFSARLTYQEASDILGQDAIEEATGPLAAWDVEENLWGLGATFDYGMGEIYGDYYRVRFADARVDTADRWVAGATYRFSQPMFVYGEVYQQDSSTSVDESIRDNFEALNDDVVYTVGVRYDF